ncbi:sigma-70 family RNA polymerase sigma factor [Haloimpatiens sp. FM7315]|uniref:sigma-70 family RNA polymerase sigma factor n=1 Tax=Haloimpatiens sp. FM7315 TaxID=3298609 RepID=UPI00370C3157
MDFIVDKFSNLVFKVTRSVLNSTGDFHEVEECCNDVFFSVWKNIDSFDENKGNFKYWISAVAKYKAIDYKRKLFKESIFENINDCSLCNDFNTEKKVISKENRRELLKAISGMKGQDKEIFIRRYFLDEDIENIAKNFGVNRSSIDKRLSRGRKALREKLMFLKGEIS